MTDTTPCRLCDIPRSTHAQQWTPEAGWHRWNPPIRRKQTEEQQ